MMTIKTPNYSKVLKIPSTIRIHLTNNSNTEQEILIKLVVASSGEQLKC